MNAPIKPTVGRIVHYVSHGTPVRSDGTQAYTSECRAAIVTEVTEHPDADGTVGLAVLNPTGMFFNRGVAHAEDKAAGAAEHPGGTWHWPERADG
ncbi:MAG: hypothetical protein HOQ47_00735 [Streptomyces sp.]|nr:hypothetical protein [Streptomyces sp.]